MPGIGAQNVAAPAEYPEIAICVRGQSTRSDVVNVADFERLRLTTAYTVPTVARPDAGAGDGPYFFGLSFNTHGILALLCRAWPGLPPPHRARPVQAHPHPTTPRRAKPSLVALAGW